MIKHFKCKCQRAGSKFTRHIHYRFTTAESQVLKFPHATLKQQKADGAETQTNLNHRLHFTSLQQCKKWPLFRVYTIILFYYNFCNCTKAGDIYPFPGFLRTCACMCMWASLKSYKPWMSLKVKLLKQNAVNNKIQKDIF